MSEDGRAIPRLVTGVPGLDPVLGGGLPRYSFNIIAGTPGAGKTTLAQHIMFNLATPEEKALYVTVLGEPPLKMLRYQRQFAFFDDEKVGTAVHYLNLNDEVLGRDPGSTVGRILEEVDRLRPDYVIVDSFRSFARSLLQNDPHGVERLQGHVQKLALHLAAMEATTFLIGEYPHTDRASNPVFTVADGILWLYQPIDNNSTTRKLQVMKMRGADPLPGLHSLRITPAGLRVFPRGYRKDIQHGTDHRFESRMPFGVPALDEMLGGGLPEGEAALLSGPPGSGKSTLALQFAAAGLEAGESVVLAVFEERPEGYVAKARSLGIDLKAHIRSGRAEVVYLRSLDLSVDETLFELYSAVQRLDARRVVLDSISGLEVALAPSYEAEFRETLYNLSAFLTDHGVTVLMTVETAQAFTELRFTPNAISLIADTFILQRYVEIESRLQPVITVVKMRHSRHSREVRRFSIDENGLQIGDRLADYEQIVTGVPIRTGDADAGPDQAEAEAGPEAEAEAAQGHGS